MPPVDNNTPATPLPQEPKKGFFAKLFGMGKKSETSSSVVPPAHESQTPAPQLSDTQDPSTPGEGALSAVPDVPVEAMPTTPVVPAPSVEAPSVAESVPAAPVDVANDVNVAVVPEEDKTTTNPAPPTTV